MINKILIIPLSLILYFGLINANSLAQDILPEIKASAIVEDSVVTLNDIFSNLNKGKDIVIADAPAPGKKTIISARHVLKLTRSNNIHWKNSAGVKNIIISRMSTVVTYSELTQMLSDELKNIYLADNNIDVRLYNNNGKIHLPFGYDIADLSIKKINIDRRNDKFSALVHAPTGLGDENQHMVNGRILRVTMIPALTRTIRSGETIKKSDINWISMPDKQISRNTVRNLDKLIGMTPRNQIKQGNPIRLSEVRRPILVKRGSLVKINFNTANINLTTIGKAVENGGKGDVIQVINNTSKKTISATVFGFNQVQVNSLTNNIVLLSQ